MTTHRLRLLLTLAAISLPTGGVLGQGAFPAPSSEERDACAKGYASLREDAENKGKVIRAASEQHAPAEETCKLIGAYSAAEVKMIKYVEANAAGCGIPGSVMEQLRAGHKNTEGLLQKVCAAAKGARDAGPDQRFRRSCLRATAVLTERFRIRRKYWPEMRRCAALLPNSAGC